MNMRESEMKKRKGDEKQKENGTLMHVNLMRDYYE
jgi:hypothetical protein